jgi:predicted Rossmann fold flavoprotein
MQIDTLIIGAGAAGMMCAANAGGRVVIVDHAKAPGEKIRISGGGRCNFTNMHCAPHAFLSQNPHFAKSALARYTQWDFDELVDQHSIKWHEKTLGQLFCDTSAKEIVAMFRTLMQDAGVELHLQTSVGQLSKTESGYSAVLTGPNGSKQITARNLVVASGGKSIPKMGATGFAYDIARQFDLALIETQPALVPFTFAEDRFTPLAGVATPARVTSQGTSFDEAILFTHRGLSGPVVLQASSYWADGQEISVNIDPDNTLMEALRSQRQDQGRKNFTTELAKLLPSRLVDHLAKTIDLRGNLADQSDKRLAEIIAQLQNWTMTPSGTEGYRTAEVTLGGVDTDGLSSKTMAAKSEPSLYFIGEAVDVTGWLGGYNFQWAWSSGWAAGQAIAHQPEAPR